MAWDPGEVALADLAGIRALLYLAIGFDFAKSRAVNGNLLWCMVDVAVQLPRQHRLTRLEMTLNYFCFLRAIVNRPIIPKDIIDNEPGSGIKVVVINMSSRLILVLKLPIPAV
jgi:hypothetical protein